MAGPGAEQPAAAEPLLGVDALRVRRARQDIVLRRAFAVVGLVLLVVELALATVVFWTYGTALRWRVPDAVISTYLGGTVVQVVSVVLVMTRSLFAARDAPE